MTRRHGWRWAGALALAGLAALGALPAAAQEPGFLLEGMSDDQVIAFFTEVSASEELDAVIAPAIDEMLAPGEAVPGWREGGVDILAEIGAREGGLAANLLRDEDTEVLSITDLSGTVTPDLPGFTSLRIRPAAPGANERIFASFAPGVWLAFDMQRTARGNAQCYAGLIGVTIHSKTGLGEWNEDQVFATVGLIATFDRLAGRTFCTLYERAGTAYQVRSFLPDGRRLPNLDAEGSPVVVMPAVELAPFMQTRSPQVPAE